MILQEIKEQLDTINSNNWYGMVDNIENLDVFDYIVFFRDKTVIDKTKNTLSDYYVVAIVQENFIEEDFILEVIEKMQNIKGMRVCNNDIYYEYTKKPNTDTILEIASISFVKARK